MRVELAGSARTRLAIQRGRLRFYAMRLELVGSARTRHVGNKSVS